MTSLCFYKIINGKKHIFRKKMVNFQIVENTTIVYYLNKLKIDEIMQQILIDYCNATVLGYDKSEDKYWCKICNKSVCELYVKIKVTNTGNNLSEVEIIPLVGTNITIKNFIRDFDECIKLYQHSNFIKSMLDKSI